MTAGPDVFLTVDVEPDCPPFLWTWRGIDAGAPRLLGLLREEAVAATFFTTGTVAHRSPDLVNDIVAEGHELASHAMTHRDFSGLDEETARWEIQESARILRRHAPVVSFRAPYLRFPERYVALLAESGFAIDASLAKYKRSYLARRSSVPMIRVAASITSSALRLPTTIRDQWLNRLRSPIVLFVHPWEFVDLTRTRIRWDCRVRTGEPALESLRAVIRHFASRGARFRRVNELLGAAATETSA